MINNPLQIAPGTIFICGNTKGITGYANDSFERIEKKLSQKGHKVFNPLKNVEALDFKKRIAFLTMCDIVATLPEWENNEEATKEVSVARALGKKVVFAESFQ